MQTYLSDVLHAVSQALLAPDIILLLLFICYALFSIGSVLVEFFTERRNFKVAMPKFLAALMNADEADIPQVINESGLLNRQKEALNTVYEYRGLPGDALISLVKRLVSEEETRYEGTVGRNNTAAKAAPMLGLMGTLIPLGPGIQALGQADTAALSASLLVAFDTTVAGLVTAVVCLIIGKVRTNWYDDYLSALDAAMATMLEKIEATRDPNAPVPLPSPSEEKPESPEVAASTSEEQAKDSAPAEAPSAEQEAETPTAAAPATVEEAITSVPAEASPADDSAPAASSFRYTPMKPSAEEDSPAAN